MNAQEFIFKTALLAEAAYASSDKLSDGSMIYPEPIRKLIEHIKTNSMSTLVEVADVPKNKIGQDETYQVKRDPTQAAIDKGHKALEAKFTEIQSNRLLKKASKELAEVRAALQ